MGDNDCDVFERCVAGRQRKTACTECRGGRCELREVSSRRKNSSYDASRKRGHSKNGRGDAPPIVIGLAVTRDGQPVRSWVFPGNTADVTTVAMVKEDLRGWRLGRCVFVGDASMSSLDSRRSLSLGGGKHILAARMRSDDEVTNEVMSRAGRYHEVRDNLRVKEVIVGDGERRQRYVVRHNPAEAERQLRHRERTVAGLEAELASLRQSNTGKHSKRAEDERSLSEVLEGILDRQLSINRSAVSDAARYDGKWVITSNDDTLSAEGLALGYKQLMRVEDCWRRLKSGIRLRPVFHWVPWRIQAHVTISVLALLLERIAEARATDTWRNVRAELERIQVVEYEHGDARVQQTTELRSEATTLLRKLGVAAPPRLHAIDPLPGVEASA